MPRALAAPGPATRHDVGAAAAFRRLLADRVLRAAAVASCLWVAAFAVATALVADHPEARQILGNVVYVLPVAAAAVLATAAAVRLPRGRRGFWVLLAVSNWLWTAGELTWSAYELVLHEEIPFPSRADVFYLASYCVVVPAVLVGFWRTRRVDAARVVLDASILAVAVGFAGYALLIEPQLGWGASPATITGIAYPLVGVVILTVLVAVGFGTARTPVSLALIAAAFAISALTDAGYTYAAVLHEYVAGGWLNVGWQAEAVLLCFAALVALRLGDREPTFEAAAARADRGLPLILFGVAATLSIVVLHFASRRLLVESAVVGVYAAGALVARLLATSRDKDRIASRLQSALAAQQRLAVTDVLTGLHNRRFFEEVVGLETERAKRSGRSVGLLVLDLDHFKLINDRYGHVVGDAVLREAAQRFTRIARTGDVVARYGGEEFVVLVAETDARDLHELGERCRRTIADRTFVLEDGRELTVTTSIGGAVLPDDGLTGDELVRAADKALYLAKARGRNRVQLGADDAEAGLEHLDDGAAVIAFLQDLSDDLERGYSHGEHGAAMARTAGRLADALGLPADARRRCVDAARLHDVGKLAVPERILAKREPLTEEEWEEVRRHPDRGARILALVPALRELAPIVRDHHERVDGRGYPAGRSGAQLSIEARIVAVCDAWAAMTTDRAYRAALSLREATDELRRGAGTQFDADVVRAFLALQATAALDDGRDRGLAAGEDVAA